MNDKLKIQIDNYFHSLKSRLYEVSNSHRYIRSRILHFQSLFYHTPNYLKPTISNINMRDSRMSSNSSRESNISDAKRKPRWNNGTKLRAQKQQKREKISQRQRLKLKPPLPKIDYNASHPRRRVRNRRLKHKKYQNQGKQSQHIYETYQQSQSVEDSDFSQFSDVESSNIEFSQIQQYPKIEYSISQKYLQLLKSNQQILSKMKSENENLGRLLKKQIVESKII